MPKVTKSLKTLYEGSKGKNLRTIDTRTKKVSKNTDLEKLAEKNKLPGYEVVKVKKIEKYVRSKKDQNKENNLDPKIKNNKTKKNTPKK